VADESASQTLPLRRPLSDKSSSFFHYVVGGGALSLPNILDMAARPVVMYQLTASLVLLADSVVFDVLCSIIIQQRSRDNAVGIATRFRLDGPGIESPWGRDFSHPSRPALDSPSLLHKGYRVFHGGKAAGTWL